MKYLLLGLLLHLACLHAEDIDVTKPIRMNQLIPQDRFPFTLPVEPALPSDFIVYSDYDMLYWGPEMALHAYFKDSLSLTVPIMCAQISPDLTQSMMMSFDEESIKKQAKRNGKTVSVRMGSWGAFPFYTVNFAEENKHLAFIGLNDGDLVLVVGLVIPSKMTEKLALDLWDNFFKNTKILPEPLLFKAYGQEMHRGYTIVNVAKRLVKVKAEKRKSDGNTRFVVIPLDQGVKFQFQEVLETQMGAKWHFKEPMLKIAGTYVVDELGLHSGIVTSVLIANVEEFTPLPLDKDNLFIRESGDTSFPRDWSIN